MSASVRCSHCLTPLLDSAHVLRIVLGCGHVFFFGACCQPSIAYTRPQTAKERGILLAQLNNILSNRPRQ